VEETASFLTSLLASHGPNYLVKLFGTKARSSLEKLGGPRNVAIALSGEHNYNANVRVNNFNYPSMNMYMCNIQFEYFHI